MVVYEFTIKPIRLTQTGERVARVKLEKKYSFSSIQYPVRLKLFVKDEKGNVRELVETIVFEEKPSFSDIKRAVEQVLVPKLREQKLEFVDWRILEEPRPLKELLGSRAVRAVIEKMTPRREVEHEIVGPEAIRKEWTIVTHHLNAPRVGLKGFVPIEPETLAKLVLYIVGSLPSFKTVEVKEGKEGSVSVKFRGSEALFSESLKYKGEKIQELIEKLRKMEAPPQAVLYQIVKEPRSFEAVGKLLSLLTSRIGSPSPKTANKIIEMLIIVTESGEIPKKVEHIEKYMDALKYYANAGADRKLIEVAKSILRSMLKELLQNVKE